MLKSTNLFLTIIFAVLLPVANANVFVNKQKLNDSELKQLVNYGIQVMPGRYWLDCFSGLWGYEGDLK